MRQHELLSHKADARMRAAGDSAKELFTASLEGMCELIQPEPKFSGKEQKEEIELKSLDQTTLLIDFLSEVLTQIQVDRILYNRVKFEALTKNSLHATIFGQKTPFFRDVKAVTYHEADIQKDKQGILETHIVFDI